MKKTHIRSYAVVEEGDIEVIAWNNGKSTNLSAHYADVPRDRHTLEPDAALDVFRYENGDLTWSTSVSGHDIGSAGSIALLLRCLCDDAAGRGGDARAL